MTHNWTLIYNASESTLAIYSQKCPQAHPQITSPRLSVVVVRRVEIWTNVFTRKSFAVERARTALRNDQQQLLVCPNATRRTYDIGCSCCGLVTIITHQYSSANSHLLRALPLRNAAFYISGVACLCFLLLFLTNLKLFLSLASFFYIFVLPVTRTCSDTHQN